MMLAAGDTDSRKPTSQLFAAQIQQLEIEGSKLVAATDMLSGMCPLVFTVPCYCNKIPKRSSHLSSQSYKKHTVNI